MRERRSHTSIDRANPRLTHRRQTTRADQFMRAWIVIVADDLTGAADCGVACTAAGVSTVVVLNDATRARDLNAEAIAFDADTRHQTSEQASAATERAVRQLCSVGSTRVLYKKIDSTLRGNFAIEIAAARNAASDLLFNPPGRNQAALAHPLAIVAPAFPVAGRTTIAGRMFVRGMPLEETEVWRNEGIGGIADLPALLEEKAGRRLRHCGRDVPRSRSWTGESPRHRGWRQYHRGPTGLYGPLLITVLPLILPVPEKPMNGAC